MVAGQPQLQQQPGSVQFRQPLPPANLRPGMRLGSPGALVQVKYYEVRNELGLSTKWLQKEPMFQNLSVALKF